jgi:hypothetical protein
MRVIVTGSHSLYPRDHALKIVAELMVRAFPGDLRIVHGCCPSNGLRNVDFAFDEAAMELGVEVEQFHPEQYGPWPGCGPKRNSHMVRCGADLGIAYHNELENSRGSLDCAWKMVAAGIPVDWFDGTANPPCRILAIEGRRVKVAT